MKKYLDLIENTRLITQIDAVMTTGDLEYPGMAIEVYDEKGEDLFHIAIDSRGEKQVLFFSHNDNYRLPLEQLEKILSDANEYVGRIDEV